MQVLGAMTCKWSSLPVAQQDSLNQVISAGIKDASIQIKSNQERGIQSFQLGQFVYDLALLEIPLNNLDCALVLEFVHIYVLNNSIDMLAVNKTTSTVGPPLLGVPFLWALAHITKLSFKKNCDLVKQSSGEILEGPAVTYLSKIYPAYVELLPQLYEIASTFAKNTSFEYLE